MREHGSFEPYGDSPRLSPLVGLLLLIPLLSGLAAYYGASGAVLVTYLIIGVTVFLVLVKIPEELRDKVYLLAVSCVALSLFFSTELVSPYISGNDMQREFYLFNQVLMNGGWHAILLGSTGRIAANAISTSAYSTALSVTVLPAILNIESSIGGALIFKFVFPILYSMVPIILYRVYRQFLGPQGAFLSVFVFMVDPAFYVAMLQLGRQMIAEIFLALLVLIAVSKRKQSKTLSGALLTLVLSIGIITAHYSIAYVFLLLMLGSFFMAAVSRRVERVWDSWILLAWLVLMLCWFLAVTGGGAMIDLTTNVSYIWAGIVNDLLSPASRPEIVQNALFLNAPMPGILHTVSRVVQYAAFATIVIGFLVFLRKGSKNIAEKQLIPLAIISIGMLFAAVTLPNLGSTLNFVRFFNLALIFIAPLFFIGGQWILSKFGGIIPRRMHLPRVDTKVSLATLIFLYFIFTSGWVWAATRDPYPTSIVIDSQRMRDSTNLSIVQGYYGWYDTPQDVAGVSWLREFGSPMQPVCADKPSTFYILDSYGNRDPSNPNLAHVIEYDGCTFSQGEYVYLSVFNSLYHADSYGMIPSHFLIQVAKEDRVYSGEANVYYP